ncbi:MAG: DUF1810 domain-containing protein [Roseiarcus sp.]|jgi:uncharacterized protein (DUF1810 family)
MNDPYRLARYIDAQERIFDQACAELRAGAKRGHWMWFVFPQIEGLGASETARRFAISCRAEAEAYLRHPVLGPRLRECAELVIGVNGRSAREIFGHPDDLKFHSSITLFASVAEDGAVFEDALQKYFAGRRDRLTMERI